VPNQSNLRPLPAALAATCLLVALAPLVSPSDASHTLTLIAGLACLGVGFATHATKVPWLAAPMLLGVPFVTSLISTMSFAQTILLALVTGFALGVQVFFNRS
jgi:hypothetical protein